MFKNAEVVVSESGAALTNILFMSAGANVIEIHPGNDVAGLWGNLAKVVNVNLQVVYGKQRKLKNFFSGSGSYTLDLREFERVLNGLV